MEENNPNEIKVFLEYYFQTRKFQYLKNEIPQHKKLIELGVLYEIKENNDVLEIDNNSIKLNKVVLEIAENKLQKKLPLDISEAFKFIDEFDNLLKKEFNCERIINSFSQIIRGLKSYTLYFLYKKNINIKDFLLSLSNKEDRENHLFLFEDSFFSFLPLSSYSEKEIVEIINELWENESQRNNVIIGLRELPNKNLKKGKQLLEYALNNDISVDFISDLLIGIYNVGDVSVIGKIIELKDKNFPSCLKILGRLDFKSVEDIDKTFNQFGNLDFENKEIARHQSYLLSNIIKNKYVTKEIRENAFKLYADFLNNGADEIKHLVFNDIYLINENEADKYNLLHLYLSKTGNFEIISQFFLFFENPVYVFDIMMRLFNATPDYRFPLDLFIKDIRRIWNINQKETEQQILNLFKQYTFGILGVKVVLGACFGIFHVNLLKLDKSEYQINAINSICKYPHSFDKLLPLILPLRNSKLKGVREHLQKRLAQKVFSSYHEIVYRQIESNITKTKTDKEFLKLIKKALDDYHKLKELKESINDLNPYENERDLMDLYYRLEDEAQAKMMNEVNAGKGTFMEMIKNVIIVRGNSLMIREGEISPLAKYESSTLIDGNGYLNPDLYEYNLNITK